MLGVYLSDLQLLEGEEVEKMIFQALEAADMMESTLNKVSGGKGAVGIELA